MGQLELDLDNFRSPQIQLDDSSLVDVTPRSGGAIRDAEDTQTQDFSNLHSTPTATVASTNPLMMAAAARDKDLEFKIPYGPLRTLNPSHMALKYQLFEQLSNSIPLNEFDLPNYYYRADMLDHNAIREGLREIHGLTQQDPYAGAPPTTALFSPHKGRANRLRELQTLLDAATVSLDYSEGFPKTDKGLPYWQQLEAEPRECHSAFIDYLEMGGARQLHLLSAYDLTDLKSWFHIYGWNYRVRAFDLFKIANAQKVRLQRMLSTEDDHYFMAERILKTVDKYVGDNIQDLLGAEDLGSLVGILEKLVKVQRISIGLPAAGGPVPEQKPQGAPTIHVITQQVVEQGRQSIRAEAEDGGFNLLQDDPDSLEIAQELIIRTQKTSNQNKDADRAAASNNLPVIDLVPEPDEKA